MRPNFDATQVDALFAEIVSPNLEMQQNMYGYNIYRRLLRAGYEAKLVKCEDNFSHIIVRAEDDYSIEMTPMISKDGTPLPMMAHQELTGEVRKISEELFGTKGMYLFQATFTVKHATFNDERAEELGLDREDSREEAIVGSVTSAAYDFHGFFLRGLYEIAKKLDTEIYPQMRTNRRKHF